MWRRGLDWQSDAVALIKASRVKDNDELGSFASARALAKCLASARAENPLKLGGYDASARRAE